MKKSQQTSQPRDRLSELPDSLILEIFWFLLVTDVARTTILSKRWKNLWTTTPYLNFSFKEGDGVGEDDFPSFVNLALLSWRGTKIGKLKIDHPLLEYWYPVNQHFEVWMRFAVDKKVEEMYLHWPEMNPVPYMMPQCIYSCSPLILLSIEGCDINIKGNVKWDNLKILRIGRVRLKDSEHLFQKILCGSPHLEELILGLWNSNENINIQSHTLKRLAIDNFVGNSTQFDTVYNVVLKLSSPKLEHLEISGRPFTKCLLLNVSSISDAALRFYGFGIEPCFENILPAIKHVVRLTLSDDCLKVFEDLDHQQFLNVKFLKIHACCVEPNQMVDFLEMFPALNMLVLENENEGNHIVRQDPQMFYTFQESDWKSSKPKRPEPFLLQLRACEILWNVKDDSVFPFVELVFKYASNLEKMVIRAIQDEGMPSSDSMLLASQKLSGMQKTCRFSIL